jgi:hypothetical protein
LPALQKATPSKAISVAKIATTAATDDARPAKRKRSPMQIQTNGAAKEVKKSKPRERLKQIMVDGHVQYTYTMKDGTVLKANGMLMRL